MNTLREHVRASSSHMDVSELLGQPVTELLGVTAAAAAALQPLGITTVFDLGCSWLFANARAAAFALGDGGPAASHGSAPGDLLNDGVAFETLETVASLPLDALRGLTTAQANALASALDVDSLRDLALWPPHAFAKSLVSGTIGGTEDPDVVQTERLRPRFGEFPTERVYYTTLTMLRMNENGADGMRALDGGVSLDTTLALRNGFTKPAVGALLTYSQSWYVQGITFGHLLHSLALAPGEATRIAVIDWARRTTATATESITEAEQLDTASSHARAISEVQEAVANEMQEGGSMSTSHAESSSNSAQASLGTGFLTSLYASGDASVSTQSATTDTTASSSSWSIGNRSVAASMSQNINDRTEQHSTSVRNRRATAVREVSQSEHEQVSTRVVANYNHMHALTVQYYEIVQVYRVSTRLHRADRCLFIPMERIDFGGPKGAQYVERFRGAIVRAALNRRVRDLLLDDASAVEITPTSAPITMPANRFELVRAISVRSAATPLIARVAASAGVETPGAAPTPAPAPVPATPRRLVWDVNELAVASRFVTRPLVRPGSDSLFAPDDTELLAISFDGVTIAKLRLDRLDPIATDTDLTVTNGRVDLPAGTRLGELDGLFASRADGSASSGTMLFHCAFLGRRFTLPAMPIEVGTAMSRLATFHTDEADRERELLAHLHANAAYYTNSILRSLDSATLVLLLSEFTWNGRPVIDQVEPKPLTIAGNFIVLRAPAAADEGSGVFESGSEMNWDALLRKHGFDLTAESDARVIPIPTNGVFAEAVLGRSNSAEKLEYTRFWNWQDSPIPLQPPEIAPVATGSRGTAEDLRPGQLGQPVLNILNPSALPDPAGLGAVLTAVANGNMFRDMAGLAGTQKLAGDVAKGTVDATTAAAEITSANMRAQMQKAVAMGQIAADLAKTAMGVPASGGGNNTISAEAARVAHGQKLDSASGTNASNGVSSTIGGGGGADGGGGGGSGGGPGIDPSSNGGSAERAAFDRGLFGPLGTAGGELARESLALVRDAAFPASPRDGAPAPPARATSAFVEQPQAPQMTENDARTKDLQDAIAARRAQMDADTRRRLDNTAFAIAKLGPKTGPVEFAGVRARDMFYSASLLKLALLYPSFMLVDRVNKLAQSIAADDEKEFFDKIRKAFAFDIASSIATIPGDERSRVQFEKVLKPTDQGGRYSVALQKEHADDLKDMILRQHVTDAPATRSIRRLGISYINGALRAGGFFNLATKQKMWLGLDFARSDNQIRVPVATGGDSGTAMTAIGLLAYIAAMDRGELVDEASSREMLSMFSTGNFFGHALGLPFTRHAAKVGHSDSADARVPKVKSEGAILEHDTSRFAVVWQNHEDSRTRDLNVELREIYSVIEEVMSKWP